MRGLPPAVTACLFDLDGVLTDTASVHRAAWKGAFDPVLAEHDQPAFTDADYLQHVDGKPRQAGVHDFLASRGITADEAAIGAAKQAELERRIREDGVVVFPDARAYLQECAEVGVRRAVVSSSANTRLVLEVTGLAALVEEVVDGTWDLPGKPAPDAFLAGARLLGVTPQQAAVFEDALAGVAAGAAGGFAAVVGVDRVGQAAELTAHGATVVVRDLGEL